MLASQGQGDLVWGHVSVRDPDGRGTWLKAAGYGLDEIGLDQVTLVGWDGSVLEPGRRHLEWPIHVSALRARPDVGAVVHTHPVRAVAFASTGQPLRPLSHEGVLFVPPDIARFERTGDLITTLELGDAVAAALGERNAVLLRHHGIVTVGSDVATAVVTAVMLDRACHAQLLALGAGGPVTWSDDEEAVAKRSRHFSPESIRGVWDYLVRRSQFSG